MAVAKTSPKTAVATKATASKAKAAKAADNRFQQAKRASILLKHVSDPTRLQVILILSEGERHVGALCASSARASRPSAITWPCSGTAISSPLAARARTTSTA